MALLFLLCCSVSWTSVIVTVCSLCVFLSMCVLCFTVLVNCLLNAFSICVGEVLVFSLKAMVLFLGCVFWLIHVLSSKVSDLCVCMRDVISLFKSEIEGSHSFCALMLFQCSILRLMCSGRSLHVACILPFGCYVCLREELFVKMVFQIVFLHG